ncbi:uncharacterized protein [Clytia hemisphaerica]|uniref:Uncharacterized protein n=1 Tax=Clytia hemisphaerica TaxID=252671 RepID=A0A7M5TWB6_9CNID|eukprot:TCONS_00056154-protein
MGKDSDNEFYYPDGKDKYGKNKRGVDWKKIGTRAVILILIFLVLRYFYGGKPETPRIKKGTYNVADFKDKVGEPIFDPSKLKPLKRYEDPEGCPPFVDCEHLTCNQGEDRVIRKDENGCRICTCIIHNSL